MDEGHHYIFGETEDYLTGEVLTDTHDERYRQKIARFLVEEKGYAKEDIRPRLDLMAQAGENCRQLMVDFAITANQKTAMIVRYAPGSLAPVTGLAWQRPACLNPIRSRLLW